MYKQLVMKTPPNNEYAKEQRDMGKQVKLMWEMRGPPNTEIAWLSWYIVDCKLAIVETFKDNNGWMLFDEAPGRLTPFIDDEQARDGDTVP